MKNLLGSSGTFKLLVVHLICTYSVHVLYHQYIDTYVTQYWVVCTVTNLRVSQHWTIWKGSYKFHVYL